MNNGEIDFFTKVVTCHFSNHSYLYTLMLDLGRVHLWVHLGNTIPPGTSGPPKLFLHW